MGIPLSSNLPVAKGFSAQRETDAAPPAADIGNGGEPRLAGFGLEGSEGGRDAGNVLEGLETGDVVEELRERGGFEVVHEGFNPGHAHLGRRLELVVGNGAKGLQRFQCHLKDLLAAVHGIMGNTALCRDGT